VFITCLIFGFLNLAEAEPEASPNTQPEQEVEYSQNLKQRIIKESREEENLPLAADSYFRFMPSSGAIAQSGSISLDRFVSEFSYDVKAFNELPVELIVSLSQIDINNSTIIKFPAQLTAFSFQAATTLPFFNFHKTYLRLELEPSWYTANWNFRGSSFTVPSRVILIWQRNDKFTLVAGLSEYPDNNTPVLPILGFIYTPNDKLTFDIIPLKPSITYKLSDKWSIFAEGGVTFEEYFLKNKRDGKVILEYHTGSLGSGLKYAFNKFIQASFSTGALFQRYFGYDPDRVGKVNLKNGLYTEFRLQMNI